jgi:hypothetical protein
VPQRKPKNPQSNPTPPPPSQEAGEPFIIKSRRSLLSIQCGYDTNQVEATLDFLDSLLTGKLGATSGFTIAVDEFYTPEKEP